MIKGARLFKISFLTAISFTLVSFTSFAQYAATDYYYMDDSGSWEAILGGNPDLSFEMDEDEDLSSEKHYYASGALAEVITFKNGKEEGEAKFYHPNGQLAMSGYYKDGQMVGLWKFFNEDGHIPTGTWEWNIGDSANAPRIKGQLIYGKPYGTWTYRSAKSGAKEFKITFD